MINRRDIGAGLLIVRTRAIVVINYRATERGTRECNTFERVPTNDII